MRRCRIFCALAGAKVSNRGLDQFVKAKEL
jgi:hypothetical protein